MKKVREGYKITEFGEIPEEWNISKLSEITELITKGATPMTYGFDFEDEGINFIKVENIMESGKIDKNSLLKISEECNNKLSRSKIQKGDILMSIAGTLGRTAIISEEVIPANTNQALAIIRLKKINNVDYINKTLSSSYIKKHINMIGTVGAQPNLSLKQIGDFNILLPSIKEQEKIASILSTVDEQIDNVDALIEKNKELKKGLMQTLLTKGIGHTKFKKTEIGEIPEKWEVKNVSDVAEKVCVGFVGSLNKYYTSSEKGIPMIRTTNLSQKGLLLKDLKYVTNEFHIKNKKSIVKKNDILVARHGESGKACLVDCDIDANCLNIVIIRPDTNTINPQYLKEIINSESVIKQVNNSIVGSVQNVVNTKTIAELKMAIPSIEEQEKIVLILSEVDDKIEEYENKKQKLEEIKKGLMQQLLTGKIRVL